MTDTRPPASLPGDGEERGRDNAEHRASYDAYVERAMQYHALHGVWPPDPLLDEVEEARRKIMAEHGNDWRKVLAWYGELDEQRRERESGARMPDQPDTSAAAA